MKRLLEEAVWIDSDRLNGAAFETQPLGSVIRLARGQRMA